MDNLIFTVPAAIDSTILIQHLGKRDVRVTRQSANSNSSAEMRFSLRAGKWGGRWLFRFNETRCLLSCSGGVCSTFFGHNVLVPRNETVQLLAIVEIVAADLRQLSGLVFPADALRACRIKRVELTYHHRLESLKAVKSAVAALYTFLKARFGKRAYQNHNDLINPGTVGLGATKSSRVFRTYDLEEKCTSCPPGIEPKAWKALRRHASSLLRTEQIFDQRSLARAGLDVVDGWLEKERLDDLVARQYRRIGLDIAFERDLASFDWSALARAHPTFVRYLEHWQKGRSGQAFDARSGSGARFKRYMLDKGFDVDVPHADHWHLAHGLHELLDPRQAEPIPFDLKALGLFDRWWES